MDLKFRLASGRRAVHDRRPVEEEMGPSENTAGVLTPSKQKSPGVKSGKGEADKATNDLEGGRRAPLVGHQQPTSCSQLSMHHDVSFEDEDEHQDNRRREEGGGTNAEKNEEEVVPREWAFGVYLFPHSAYLPRPAWHLLCLAVPTIVITVVGLIGPAMRYVSCIFYPIELKFLMFSVMCQRVCFYTWDVYLFL